MMMKAELNNSGAGCGSWVADVFIWKKIMYADVVRTASIMDVRRVRQLPFPGSVLVTKGDRVNPEDVIAEASQPSGIMVLDVARGLGVSPDEVQTCMVRDIDDELEDGDVIAQFEGTLSRLVRTPAGGRLMDITNGQVVIATGDSLVQVRAGMMGDVADIIPEYGAVLQIRGCLLQGVWGNGQIGMGVLQWVDSSQSAWIQVSDLDELKCGQVLAGGLCLQAAVLECALEKEAKGLVLDAVAPELIPTALAMPFPVIVLGGFGELPMDQKMMTLIQNHTGKTACVNASVTDPLNGQRPEVVIPLDERWAGEPLGFQTEITIGRRVRILCGEYIGHTGEVEACPDLPVRFESGLEVPSVVVRLDDGESATVPQNNIIILD
jgi:hypothetical protein